MQKTTRIIALIILLAALALLIFARWTPALMFLPIGTVMLMWGGRIFSLSPPQGRRDPRQPYE